MAYLATREHQALSFPKNFCPTVLWSEKKNDQTKSRTYSFRFRTELSIKQCVFKLGSQGWKVKRLLYWGQLRLRQANTVRFIEFVGKIHLSDLVPSTIRKKPTRMKSKTLGNTYLKCLLFLFNHMTWKNYLAFQYTVWSVNDVQPHRKPKPKNGKPTH